VRGWLRSSKFLEWWSVKTLLYVVNFLLYILVYRLLHWLMRPTLQLGGYIMYSYISYKGILSLLHLFYFLYKQHLVLYCERLCMDCSISLPGHLVGNKLGWMHDLSSVQNLRSKSFTCESSQVMSHTTKWHFAWRDLRQLRLSRVTRYPTTLEDQSLWMFG
jgi:hypothetical protein